MKLEGRVAIVTGGAEGIGQAISLSLAKEGADVVVADIEIEPANEVVNEIRTLGRKAIAIKTDVSKSEETKLMAKTALDKFGKIDILVNNAGGSARERRSLFCESTEEVWDHVLGKNLKGVLNCSRAVINHMIERRSGRIISIGSIGALAGAAGRADYAGAKAAYMGFTMSLAKEVASYGITVNNISCGPFETEWSTDYQDASATRTGLGRVGKVEEMAATVAFLASDGAGFITGQDIPVCGLANLANVEP